MKISKKDWNNYIARLRKINSMAADKVAKHMGTVDIDTDEGMKSLLDYSYAVSTAYGEAATELACQMYDAVALVSKANVPPAEPAATATYGEVVRAVKGKMFDTKEPAAVGSAVGRLVKMAGVDTTMQNALRDGAEWAWIPSGDTCAFCLTLASRGWQKASKKAIRGGHAEHIHHNCDCTYAIRFDGKSDVDGYDPDALYDEYINAGGTPQARINALRRKKYAENPEYYRAQKRAAYARKVGKPEDERSLTKRLQFSYNGFLEFIPLHTVINEPYAMAGKGTENEIRDIDRLVAVYNRDAGEWKKMAGKVRSDKYQFDIHWYECDDQIVREPKIKNMKALRRKK